MHEQSLSQDIHEVFKILVSINVNKECKNDDLFLILLIPSLIYFFQWGGGLGVGWGGGGVSVKIYRTILADKLKIYQRYLVVQHLLPSLLLQPFLMVVFVIVTGLGI
jgi:hypothetical protein